MEPPPTHERAPNPERCGQLLERLRDHPRFSPQGFHAGPSPRFLCRGNLHRRQLRPLADRAGPAEPLEAGCCGSLNHHLGKEELAKASFIKNINAWYDICSKKPIDAILVNTSGCGTTLKDYGFIFEHHPDKELSKKAKIISDMSKDITEYLGKNIKLNFTNTSTVHKIAYHSACSMQHGQKVHQQPINLLKQSGHKILEIPDGHLCCGSAGTYNLLQGEMAKELLHRKIENINKVKPDFIAAGNIGCITQIASGTSVPIVHTIELLDWFTGGSKPREIN